jgi:PAS domain S-box-containing protein
MWTALDAIADPVAITSAVRDPGGRIVDFRIDYVNPAASGWAGLDRAELIGRLITDVLPSLRPRGLLDAMAAGVETGKSFSGSAIPFGEAIVGGKVVSGAYDLRAVPHGAGQFSTWRDVSEREASVTEVRRSAELLRAIVDSSPFATMAFDNERRLMFWNRGAERIFGWTAEEVVGRPFPRAAVPDEDLVEGDALIRRTLAGADVEGVRVRRYARDGRELMLEIHGGPLRDRQGVASGYAGQMVDVTRIHEIETDLALVSRVNGVLAEAVAKLAAGASLEAAAQTICDELRSLPAVDFVAVGAFVPDDGALILAASAADDIPVHSGFHLPAHRSKGLRRLADIGPWADYWVSRPEDGDWGLEMDRAGLIALAFGPIVHGPHVDGGVVIGTRDQSFGRSLVEKWASLIDFSTTPSALLAERLHARRTEIELRRSIAGVLASDAHRPVFQPIVELATGQVVGHEALTRFASGQRPDLVFADAWSVGLGAELELATLTSAIDAAHRLPAGHWLDLNVSPRLLESSERLRSILRTADRPIVLEITEHEVVEDYVALLKAIRSLGHDIRLAVDDAGAGVANFGHIIDLGPDFVKLDTSLVRRVNAHLGRQALIVGMRHFSRTSGCRLVAEGIETEEEALTLAELGVEFGQGFWLGRPTNV